MKKSVSSIVVAVAIVSTLGAFATPVAESDALVAAGNFVGSDPVGAAVFGGRTVSGALDADGLWIVSLAPSGHVIFSGSDLVEPVVGFSLTDFSEPDPESPACAMLDGARAASLAAEAAGTGTRNAKWAVLLERKPRTRLRSAGPVESPVVTIVPPFMQSHYDQLQPYNDYCPVYDSSAEYTGYRAYRGRTPCGCVATATAQVFRHLNGLRASTGTSNTTIFSLAPTG